MCSRTTNAKGQALLSDFAFSLSIFIIIVSLVFFIEGTIFEKSGEYKEVYVAEDLTENIAYRMLSYTGVPKNWDLSNVRMMGFSTGKENVINFTKIMFLNTMPYNESKKYILSDEKYDFFINITYFNDTKSIFSYGKYPFNSDDVFKMSRIALLNESIVKVDIYVWK